MKKAAEEICSIVIPGINKEFKRARTREIERSLTEGYFFDNENPVELTREWHIYCQDSQFNL